MQDFRNAFKLPDNLQDLEDQKKWAEHSIRELSLLVKVFIAFLYDPSLLVDTMELFSSFLGNIIEMSKRYLDRIQVWK